ncbi:histidinol-phosphate transaminase [Cohnella yongneupensis]|uniref:Histidinol-phosphate aminotransferase n=1 Tax=Cohnella yongneupensis TaxID=425006 RepID=A0ABW0QVF8_9BACL
MEYNKNPQARPTLQNIKPYSPGMPIWEVQERFGLTRVIKLASNENPLGPSPIAVEAIQRMLPELHRYPDADTSKLRKAIAYEKGISFDQIVVSNGGDELIKLVSEAYLETGDEVIVPSPSFSEYEFGAHLMGAEIIKVPLTVDYHYDLEAIIRAISPRTKLIYLCSPNNPTGTYMTRQELSLLLESLPKHILVMFDGAYSQYATASDYTDGIEFVKEGYSLIVLQTFSKIYGLAGIRVGFGLASSEIISHILKVKEPFNVNALAQAAALAALTDKEHIEMSKSINHNGLFQMYLHLNELGLSYIPSMSNFLMIKLGANAKYVYEALMSRGVIVRYGGSWNLPDHIRVSVGTHEENAIFIDQLRTILQESEITNG